MTKPFIYALLLALLLSSGCANMFACTTDASYIIHPDQTKEVRYSSCKEQVGLDAKFGNDVHVKVDKASTQEAVIAAVLSMQTQMMGMIKELAAKGAMAGS